MSYLTLKIIKGSAARHKKKPTKFCDPLKARSHIERQFFFPSRMGYIVFNETVHMGIGSNSKGNVIKLVLHHWFCTQWWWQWQW